jgi:hypothetical protein
MPDAIVRRTYLYSELSPTAQERARQWWRECEANDPTPLDFLQDHLSDYYGIINCTLYYSLGHCQGDGVAFEGRPDLDAWADHDDTLGDALTLLQGYAALLGLESPELSCTIQHSGNYYHECSMDLTVEYQSWENTPEHEWIDGKVRELEESLRRLIRKVSVELRDAGYAEIEYRDSEEYIAEVLATNDYEFTRRGEFVH